MSRFTETPVAGRAAAIRDSLSRDTLREAYEQGMNLSRYLESLDPSSAHGENVKTDAFNRVLRSCGFRTNSVPELGIAASTVEEVASHPRGQYLLVELIARAYRNVGRGNRATFLGSDQIAGTMMNQFAYPAAPRGNLLSAAVPLNEVVSQTTGINAKYYKPFYLEDVTNTTSRVAEAGEVPAVKIATSDRIIDLLKFGRRLDVTYEAIRAMPIDLLAFYVGRIAVKVEAEKVDKVVDVLVSGDGNTGTAATSYNLTALDSGTTAGNLTLKAWLAFKMKFKNPFMMTTVLGNDDVILKLLLLNAGTSNIQLSMMSGLLAQQGVRPINQGLADGIGAGWLDSPPASKIIGFDNRMSIERVFEIGGTLQESDKDIKTQINHLVLTEVEGYAVMEANANKILNLGA